MSHETRPILCSPERRVGILTHNTPTATSITTKWTPTVTAILPCYNAENFLAKTLDCLAVQSWPGLEILIGDDASTDQSVSIAREFVSRNKAARLITRRQTSDGFEIQTTSCPRQRASCSSLRFTTIPTYVEKLVRALRQRSEAILAFSDVELVELDATSRVIAFDKLSGITHSLMRGLVMVRRPFAWWVPNRGLFRAAAFRRIGGIRPNAAGEYSADWTWLLHMALLGEFVRVPEVLCPKFYKKGSLSKTWPHDRNQQRALKQAGIREIRISPLDCGSKLILIAYLIFPWNLKRRISSCVPHWVKRLLKALH
jgi:glycosyltransferase involved in cell wall biosynthesis